MPISLRSGTILLLLFWGLLAGAASAQPAPAAIERFANALRFETISPEDPADFEAAPFEGLIAHLAQSFPRTHAELQLERVSGFSLLYTWKGRDPGLQPILLTSHTDVVPVIPGTEAQWTHPPFGGVVADGYVWGRGTLDDKVGVMATLEGVEALVAAGFVPERTVYLAFGHDEEIGGDHGAGAITDLLESRGVRLWFSLDEGMAILSGVGGISSAVAMVGVAEKGFLTLRLTAKAAGGHSSVPTREGAIPRIASAVRALEENPLPARFGGVAAASFDALSAEIDGVSGFLLGQHRWLGGLLEPVLSSDPATDAMIRTTTAITMLDAGVKANVLPTSASAVANFRLIPGDTVDGVVAAVREIVDDPEIEITILTQREASDVASSEGPAFDVLSAAIEALDPALAVVPALVVGGTDSKHYGRIADDAYRFTPFRIGSSDASRIHGTDERIRVSDYTALIGFYEDLVRRAAGSANAGEGR